MAMWKLRSAGAGSLTGSRLTLVVLVAGLGFSSYLAYQAFQAHRSHRVTVDRALESISGMMGERFLSLLMGDVTSGGFRAFQVLDEFDELPEGARLPGPEVIEARNLRGQNCDCYLARGEGTAFRVDLDSAAILTTDPHLDEDLRSRVVEPLLERAVDRRIRAFRERFGWPLSVPGILILDGEGGGTVVVFRVLYRDDGTPRAAYGLLLSAEGFQQESLVWVTEVRREFVVPSTLGLPEDRRIFEGLALESRQGTVLSQLEGSRFGPGTSVSSLWDPGLTLRLRVSLHPDVIERLALGTSPAADRVLVFALLLLLNGGLVLASVLQVRREQRFIRRRAEFIAGFSHEARSPLATIRLYAQGLRFGRIADPTRKDRALDIIDRESRRLVHMVSNFLNHGAVGKEALRLSPRPMELGGAIRGFCSSLQPDLSERRARLEMDTDEMVWIEADPTALQQILRNLVDNALKYGPPGQAIRIRVRREGGSGVLLVEDEGPGIAKGERETVFDPFVRTSEGIRSGAGGSGLGLTVVRDLVAMLGGSVRVEEGSRGRGARFVVEFPLLPMNAAVEPSDGRADRQGGGSPFTTRPS
jgi:signal transduction histidine kinase